MPFATPSHGISSNTTATARATATGTTPLCGLLVLLQRPGTLATQPGQQPRGNIQQPSQPARRADISKPSHHHLIKECQLNLLLHAARQVVAVVFYSGLVLLPRRVVAAVHRSRCCWGALQQTVRNGKDKSNSGINKPKLQYPCRIRELLERCKSNYAICWDLLNLIKTLMGSILS